MGQLFVHAVNMSITASYVILFVLITRLLLRKVPKIFSYVLWLVVLFRLVCPVSFESAFSLVLPDAQNEPMNKIYSQFSPPSQVPQLPIEISETNQAVNNLISEPISSTPMATINITPIDKWFDLGQFIWVLGITMLLTYCIVTTVRLHIRLSSAEHIFDNVYESSKVTTPFVFGILRPKIYLPKGLYEKEKAYIIKHEQVHIKRFDHIIKPFAFFVLCVHWFNPLVWVAFFLMSEDMEKSCDESVIRQMGSEIKKDYSTSLLSLSTGRRFIGGSPLAFGESNTRGRILNILNYKKPAFWVVIVVITVVVALGVGLMSNPKKHQMTVEDYANQYMEQVITEQERNDVKIVDRTITRLEKIAEVDELLSSPLEIWALEYRLKPDDPSKVIMTEGLTADGLITEDGSMGKPMLVFSYKGPTPQYLGVIKSGENELTTKAGQEMALRMMLEGSGQLPHETFSGNHMLVKFPLTTGETSQLLLSQPVVQGDSGIWCVERWKGTNGNEYYNTPQTDDTIAKYYDHLQQQADQGNDPSLLDPLQVALKFISNDIGMGKHISLDQLVVDETATAKDFAITPESTLLGYVLNLSMDNESFDFDKVEWLTLKDTARLKGLNINPDEDMPNGFYILNKYTITDPLKVTSETKYSIVDSQNLDTPKVVSKQDFIEYFKQYSDFMPPCTITTRDGYVTSITEKYVP